MDINSEKPSEQSLSPGAPESGQAPEPVQWVEIACAADRSILTRLVDRAEQQLPPTGRLRLYGVTEKQEGFIHLEAAPGFSWPFLLWLFTEPDILRYTVHQADQPQTGAASPLSAEGLPSSYILLGEAARLPLHPDIWVAHVQHATGYGVLFYAKDKPLLFLGPEGALLTELYLFQSHSALLTHCDLSFFSQPQSEQLAEIHKESDHA
jgi:hypothetical protein